MKLNNLLDKQLQRYLPPELRSHPEVMKFCSVVSESYNSYERELELSDRAFKISEEEYVAINEQLGRNIGNMEASIRLLKSAVEKDGSVFWRGEEDELLIISKYLEEQLLRRKNAEKIFASLIDNSDDAVLLRNGQNTIIYINQLFLDTFGIKASLQDVIGREYSSFADPISNLTIDPAKYKKRLLQIIEEKKPIMGEVIEMTDGRVITAQYIPIFTEGVYNGYLWKFSDKSDWFRAQKSISESQETRDLLLNSGLDAIVILNDKGLIEYWNKQAETFFSYNPVEVINKDLAVLISSGQYDLLLKDLIHGYFNKDSDSISNRTVQLSAFAKSGKEFPVEVFFLPIIQKDRSTLWCFFRDISERKNFETRLLESEQLLSQSQKMAHIGSWEFDVVMKKVRWTDEMFRIRGYAPQAQVPDVDFFENSIHPDDRDRVKNQILTSIHTGQSFELIYRIIRADGQIRVIQDIGEIILDNTGQVIKVRGTGQDITAQIEKSDELARQKKFTEDILNNIPADIAVFDADHRYLFVNPKGIANPEIRNWIIGKDDFEYCEYRGLPMDIAHKRRELFHRAVQNKKAEVFLDERKNEKGETLYILRNYYPSFENGILKFVIGYGVDITDRRMMELQLSEALIIMKNTNRELERFAYVASHDLQEPLRMVSSFLNLIELRLQDRLDETTKKYIDFAVSGAERMKNLIQALLDYSKLGQANIKLAQTDLNDVMNEVTLTLQEKIKTKGAILDVQPLPIIMASRTLITQVFVNLVGNALKYNDKPIPRVVIGAEKKDHHWEFFIHDNGIGIESKYFDKIFEIFQRLHGKSEYSGTGIGLSICSKIVEQHGGKIWVDSEPGKGSTFYFTIPFKNE